MVISVYVAVVQHVISLLVVCSICVSSCRCPLRFHARMVPEPTVVGCEESSWHRDEIEQVSPAYDQSG